VGASQRNKGAAGERELAKLLSEALDIDCSRNLEQTRCGGVLEGRDDRASIEPMGPVHAH